MPGNAVTFFRLRSDCVLVRGLNGTALYDVPNGRLFLLDDKAAGLLQRCEENLALDPEQITPSELRIISALVADGIGHYEERPVFVDKFHINSPNARARVIESLPHVAFDWAITDSCELECGFCPRKSGDSWNTCASCLRRTEGRNAVRLFKDPTRIVNQFVAAGAVLLRIRGGDPLLEWEYLRSILEAAEQHPNLRVVVVTPGIGRPVNDVIDLCRFRNLELGLVLFGSDGTESIATCGRNVFDRQMDLADTLQRIGTGFTVAFVLRPGIDTSRVRELAAGRWQKRAEIARVRPEFTPPECGEPFGTRGEWLFSWGDFRAFETRKILNSCLAGRCDIGLSGVVYPCPGIDSPCGVISDGNLRSGLTGDVLWGWWALTREHISPCDQCAVRYACEGCTAAGLTISSSLNRAIQTCICTPGSDIRVSEKRWRHSGFVQLLRSTVTDL